MALDRGPSVYPAHREPPSRVGSVSLAARLCLTAICTGSAASSTEVSVGLDVTHIPRYEHRLHGSFPHRAGNTSRQ